MDNESIKRCRRLALELLKNHNSTKVHCEMLISRINELESRIDTGLGAVCYDQTKATTNTVSSMVENAVLEKEKEVVRLQNELARLNGQIQRLEIALNNLPILQRTLLELRYWKNLSWRQISNHLDYSEEYIRKELHQSAVNMLTGFLFPELMVVNLFERVITEENF